MQDAGSRLYLSGLRTRAVSLLPDPESRIPGTRKATPLSVCFSHCLPTNRHIDSEEVTRVAYCGRLERSRSHSVLTYQSNARAKKYIHSHHTQLHSDAFSLCMAHHNDFSDDLRVIRVQEHNDTSSYAHNSRVTAP